LAINPANRDGHGIGSVKARSQVYNRMIDSWAKSDADAGRLIAQKVDGDPL
jgi:hypothetical protein